MNRTIAQWGLAEVAMMAAWLFIVITVSVSTSTAIVMLMMLQAVPLLMLCKALEQRFNQRR